MKQKKKKSKEKKNDIRNPAKQQKFNKSDEHLSSINGEGKRGII